MPNTAQIIIFSKDRPAQLELLLRSLLVAWLDPSAANAVVLFRCEPAWQSTYDELAKIYKGYRFVDERASPSFKDALLDAQNPATENLLFLVDDQVFLRPFQLEKILADFAAAGEQCACVSLRMHPGVRYSYCFRTISPPQTLEPETLKVRWADEPNNSDWSVVMSLDGNLYRRKDVQPILESTAYKNPCFLEHQMVKAAVFSLDTYYLCQKEPLVTTVPMNQTQSTHHHRHAGLVDLAELNEAYQQGFRIALLPYWKTISCMVHREQSPLLLPPHSHATATSADLVILEQQTMPDLIRTLESVALLPTRPQLRLLDGDDVGSHALVSAYATVLNFNQAEHPATRPTPAAPGMFFDELHLDSHIGWTGAAADQLGKLAWRGREATWRTELLTAELRVSTGPEYPLSELTKRNQEPKLTPQPPRLTWIESVIRLVKKNSFRYFRQIAYAVSSAIVWKIARPATGGLREKLVTLFAGRPATTFEIQRGRPPTRPWKSLNN